MISNEFHRAKPKSFKTANWGVFAVSGIWINRDPEAMPIGLRRR